MSQGVKPHLFKPTHDHTVPTRCTTGPTSNASAFKRLVFSQHHDDLGLVRRTSWPPSLELAASIRRPRSPSNHLGAIGHDAFAPPISCPFLFRCGCFGLGSVLCLTEDLVRCTLCSVWHGCPHQWSLDSLRLHKLSTQNSQENRENKTQKENKMNKNEQQKTLGERNKKVRKTRLVPV